MKDLQTILTHAAVKPATLVQLASGRPIAITVDGAKKALGKPLNGQQLMTLIKASFPPDQIASLGWGKQFELGLPAGGRHYQAHVTLAADKTISIELIPAGAPAASAPTPAPAATSAGADEGFDEEVQRLGDIENPGFLFAGDAAPRAEIENAIRELGYNPAVSQHMDASSYALRYNDFELVIFALGPDFAEHKLYQVYTNLLMNNRRTQFSVLIAPGLSTADNMLAFTLSVDLVVDQNDVGELPDLIKRAMKQWRRTTAPFYQLLEEAGRL